MVSRTALAAGLWLGLALVARADIAPPPEPPEPAAKRTRTVPVQVEFKSKVDRARVRIPQSVLDQLQVAAAKRGGGAVAPLGGATWRTIVAGLAMSAAVVLFLVLRRGRAATAATAGTLLVGLAIGSAGVAWANAAPPFDLDPPKVPQIDIAIVADGDAVVLVVDEELYKQITAAQSRRRYRPNRNRERDEPRPPSTQSAPNDGAAAPNEAPNAPPADPPE